jgi:hypothetical protein
MAASEVKSLTAPPGPEAGISIWAERQEVVTIHEAKISAFLAHPLVEILGTIAMPVSTCIAIVSTVTPFTYYAAKLFGLLPRKHEGFVKSTTSMVNSLILTKEKTYTMSGWIARKTKALKFTTPGGSPRM